MSRGLGSTQRRALVDLYLATTLGTPLYSHRFTVTEIHIAAMLSTVGNSARAAYRRALRGLGERGLVECVMDTVDVSLARWSRPQPHQHIVGFAFDVEVLTVSLTEKGSQYIDSQRTQLLEEFDSFRVLTDPFAFDGRAKKLAEIPLFYLTYRQVVVPERCPNRHRPSAWLEHWLVVPGQFHHSFTCPWCGCSVYWPEIANPPHPFRALVVGTRELYRLRRKTRLSFVGRLQVSAAKQDRWLNYDSWYRARSRQAHIEVVASLIPEALDALIEQRRVPDKSVPGRVGRIYGWYLTIVTPQDSRGFVRSETFTIWSDRSLEPPKPEVWRAETMPNEDDLRSQLRAIVEGKALQS